MSETISHSLSIQGQKAICERSYTNIVGHPEGSVLRAFIEIRSISIKTGFKGNVPNNVKLSSKEIGAAQTAKVHHEFVYTVPAHIIVSVAKLFKVQ